MSLASLPAENLDQICGFLPAAGDVANFRLVCRLFRDIGLRHLVTTLSFVNFPDSIDRLEQVASHPVLRHSVHTLVGITDGLPRYNKDTLGTTHVIGPLTIPTTTPEVSYAEVTEAQHVYRSLWSSQEEASRTLENSDEVRNALRNLTNLKCIRLASCDQFQQDTGTVHPLVQDFRKCGVPFVPYPDFSVPSIMMLQALLEAVIVERKNITSLVVGVDWRFFNGREVNLIALGRSLSQVNRLQLRVRVEPKMSDESPWQSARHNFDRTPHLRKFLLAAPNLDLLELQFARKPLLPSIANMAHILPAKPAWPQLRRLHLSGVDIDPPCFLAFLNAHAKTLESIRLANCRLFPRLPLQPDPMSDPAEPPTLLWSIVLLAIGDLPHITSLYLFGSFTLPPTLRSSNAVALDMAEKTPYVECPLGQILNCIVCAKDFVAFLDRETKHLEDRFPPSELRRRIVECFVDSPVMHEYFLDIYGPCVQKFVLKCQGVPEDRLPSHRLVRYAMHCDLGGSNAEKERICHEDFTL